MRHGDLTNFVMMHQHTEGRNYFPQNEETSWNPTRCFAKP